MQDLASNSTFTCGTIRSDRGKFPASFTAKGNLERGESEFRCNSNTLAVRWRGEEEPVDKPIMICQYNSFMNGVDKCDQKISSYDIQSKPGNGGKNYFFDL